VTETRPSTTPARWSPRLRGLVSDKEVYDIESELPGEYAELFSRVV
jgi:hypothetical protein